MMAWASYALDKLGPRVIGVSGSSGKSVTVEAISRVLGTHFKVHQSAGEYRGRLRLPLALTGLKAEHDMVVLELGASQQGEIAEMIQTIQPDIGVITHIGHADMDSFDSLDQIAVEESRLLESLPPSGLAILNYDDDYIRAMGETFTRASDDCWLHNFRRRSDGL